jgi:biopolymer transport protein ExbD
MDENKKLYVVINRDGQAFLEGAPVSDAALAERMRALAAADPAALVIIEADKTVFHGRVVAVMDMAQVAGLRRLAIATEQKAPPPIPVLPAASPPATAGGATAP